ncbi:hypothetical protein TNCV_2021361 [Trichonephila clavipes]|nr:hypothetical protein TNCV_2021361 [Trichonephila clavipes]
MGRRKRADYKKRSLPETEVTIRIDLKIDLFSEKIAIPIPATEHQNVRFMHDGIPTHFTIAVCNHHHTTYPERWSGRGGPIPLPPRSLDPISLDSFFCDRLCMRRWWL